MGGEPMWVYFFAGVGMGAVICSALDLITLLWRWR